MNLLNILLILFLKIGQDVLFLGKIDAFNRSNKVYYWIISFIEAAYAISVIGFVLALMQSSFLYILVYGAGAVLGAIISSKIKGRLDNKLEGQRKFFARITFDEHIDESDLLKVLEKNGFEFVVKKEKYISGNLRTVIEGSLVDREEMWKLKDLLRGRKGKHVVIMRAEDVYMLR
ncbi:MAG: hypothetical protein ACOC3V_02490 [bacterium]